MKNKLEDQVGDQEPNPSREGVNKVFVEIIEKDFGGKIQIAPADLKVKKKL